jgi:hypothetical protein
MARNGYWIPFNHDRLNEMVQRVTGYILEESRRERMDFGATTRAGQWLAREYLPAYAAYRTAYGEWKNPATRVPARQERLAREEKAFRPVLRTLYMFFLRYNYFVTDDDLAGMGLPGRKDGKLTPSPVASEAPRVEVVLSRVAAVVIDHGGNRRGKARPAGQHGVEYRWVISGAPVVDHEALVHSTFGTRGSVTLEFPGRDRGKTVYFAARWENTRGQKGPFSAIGSAIIP